MFKRKIIYLIILLAIICSFAFSSEIDRVVEIYADSPKEAIVMPHTSKELAEAGNEANIYYVQDGKNQFVTKKFALSGLSKKYFESESKNYQKLTFLLPHITPTVYGYGIEDGYGYIIMQKADGLCLNQLIREATRPSFSKAKEKTLIEAMESIGIAMAQVHNQNIGSKRDEQASNERVIKKYLRFIDRQKLPNEYKQIAEKALALSHKTSMRSGLVHGDLHPGNVFYDASTKKVTIIDWETAADSYLADDYANFIMNFLAMANEYHLDEKATNKALQSFKDAYLRNNYLSPQEIDIQMAIIKMHMAYGFKGYKNLYSFALDQIASSIA